MFVLLVSLAIPSGFAGAQVGQNDSNRMSEDVTAEGRANERASRINIYKERFQEELTIAQQQRIASRCRNSQIVVDLLQTRTETVLTSRQVVYGRITNNIETLINRLQLAGVNTDDIEQTLTELSQSVNAHEASVLENTVTLSDISAINCEDDPQAFQSALVAARQQRATLFAQSQEIRSFIQDELIVALQQAKNELIRD